MIYKIVWKTLRLIHMPLCQYYPQTSVLWVSLVSPHFLFLPLTLISSHTHTHTHTVTRDILGKTQSISISHIFLKSKADWEKQIHKSCSYESLWKLLCSNICFEKCTLTHIKMGMHILKEYIYHTMSLLIKPTAKYIYFEYRITLLNWVKYH